jgi:hypothetical protein
MSSGREGNTVHPPTEGNGIEKDIRPSRANARTLMGTEAVRAANGIHRVARQDVLTAVGLPIGC